ncbi:uncharacterized protein LOC142977358 [Anticarsia gemmatalis]|uniref:uncharacterized protein LOC142977358 n=1 Tax=Anticarsia gemmatalis TaxID=129554 RepID=UPI003F767D54
MLCRTHSTRKEAAEACARARAAFESVAEVSWAHARAQPAVVRTTRAAADMDARTLVFLCLCVCAYSTPLGELYRRRSNYGVYANDYARDYEPYMYAAIPLHRPMPVIHVLSRRPIRDRLPVASVHHPVYARPPYHDSEYAPSTHNEYEYAGYGYSEPQGYGDSRETYSYQYPQQYNAPTASASQDEVTILYARPNPHGGFSYRRSPSKTAPKRSPVVTTDSPVIIRVHRYKVVKDI